MSSAFDWRAKAACRDKDPELFFPVGNTGAAYQQIEEAKAVCRTCKVIDACLKCALDTNQDYGVWGGLSEDERRALKRRAMRARRSQSLQMQICASAFASPMRKVPGIQLVAGHLAHRGCVISGRTQCHV